VITIEDGCLQGGFGSAVIEFMTDNGFTNRIKRLGIPDEVIEHGTQLELHKQCGFDPKGIQKACLELLGVPKVELIK
jgi:1-deoxy-D-xylulose-5-phosphate synthase